MLLIQIYVLHLGPTKIPTWPNVKKELAIHFSNGKKPIYSYNKEKEKKSQQHCYTTATNLQM